MAFQGEALCRALRREAAAEQTPPVGKMLEAGVPVGAGTDATRVASYNPWTSLWWLVTGKTLGGLRMYAPDNRPDRHEALRLWTEGSAWFSNEVGMKGLIKAGQLADFAMLSADYFSVDEDQIRDLESVLTVVGGRVVYGGGNYKVMAPPLPPISPDWAPTRRYALDQRREREAAINAANLDGVARSQGSCCQSACSLHGHSHAKARVSKTPARDAATFWGVLGCSCFAF
jgi:hypothetical protein